MALKKSELYSSLWQSCDELRGGMDASQYKDFVLTLLFVKYISDKYAGNPNALIQVPEGGSFADMVKLKGDKEIGDRINKIIARLAEENELKGVIDVADFNDEDKLGKGKEMVDRLSKLIAKITKASLKARINEIRKSPVIPAKAGIQESNDELATLQKCQKFIDAEAAASKQVKEAQKALDEKVFVHYPKLSADEIKQLVVKDKWLAAIEADVQAEIERVTQSLTARIKTLEERYAEPLPAILNEVTELSAHVDEHLKSMGLEWRTGV